MTPFVTWRAVAAMLAWLLVSAVAPWPGGPVHTGASEPVKPRREVPGSIGTVAPRSVDSAGWLDQLTAVVVVQRSLAGTRGEAGSYDAYVGQIVLVRSLYERGEWSGAFATMNRFMDMLEAREGGISGQAADALWDYCYVVTPPALHDVKRHRQWWEKHVEWERFFWEE